VKTAVAHLMKAGEYDLQGAARAAGMDLAKLRYVLGKSYVRRYMRELRQLEVEALCLGNAAALRKVRDTSENGMAVCQAVAKAEQIRAKFHEEDNAPGSGSRQMLPGLIIQIGRDVRVEPTQQLAGARTVESIAYERGPDPDDNLVDNQEDEALDALPEPPRSGHRKPLIRLRANSPRVAMVLRCEPCALKERLQGERGAVERLATGQQVVVHGTAIA
jgi:hypothetical protein